MMERFEPKTLEELISILKELLKLYGPNTRLCVVEMCNHTATIINTYLKTIKLDAKNLMPSIYCYEINYISVYNNSNKSSIIFAIGDNADESLSL